MVDPITTTTSTKGWAPDITAFFAQDAVPEALILRASTVVNNDIQGDSPRVRVPWVGDAAAQFVGEGGFIDVSEPTPDEVTISTGKIAQIVTVSREQFHQYGTADLVSTSVTRAVTKAGNQAFVGQASAGGLTGISETAGIVTGDPLVDSLDPLADVVAGIENNGGNPNIILANPLAFGELRKLRTGTGANTSLLGAGTEDTERKLLGIEVATSPAVPAGELLVIDSTAIASAVGQVETAQSEHSFFANDAIALRVTWRIGWGVQHSDRLGKVTIAPGE